MKRQFLHWSGVVLLVAAAVLSSACAEESASAQAAATPAANPDQVVAEVGGKPITLKDVDAKWEAFDAAERARVVQAMYQSRRNMLDQLVGDMLIEDAAKAAGQQANAFLEQDSAKRLPAITEADV